MTYLQVDLRELGYKQGKSLIDAIKVSKKIEQQVLEDVSERKRMHAQQLASLRVRLGFIDNAVRQTEQRIEQLRHEIDIIWQDRFKKPQEYALVKSLLYLSLSLLLILADIPILGRAVQHFIPDIPWKDKNDNTFPQVFFSSPIKAWQDLPDLLLPVVSILCLGFFVKPWLDSLATRSESIGDQPKGNRPMFIASTVFLLLSVLTVGAMSYVRFETATDKTQGLVSALIGFALPYISAGFFIKGYPILANRVNHFSLALRARIQTWWLEGRTKQREKIVMKAEGHDQIRRDLDLAAYTDNLIALRQAEYSDGYTAGVAELMQKTDGRTLFDRLTPIALRKIANPDA